MNSEAIAPLLHSILQVAGLLIALGLTFAAFAALRKGRDGLAKAILIIMISIFAFLSLAASGLYILLSLEYLVFIAVAFLIVLSFAVLFWISAFDIEKRFSIALFSFLGVSALVHALLAAILSDLLLAFPMLYVLFLAAVLVLLHIKNIRTVFAREIKSFYVSPLFYILGFIYLILTGFFFNISLHYGRSAEMENALYNIGFFSNFFLAILCIKLISDEKSSGTFEIVMTSPISSLEFVVGKYLSVLVVFTSLLAITLVYPFFLAFFGNPDIGVVLSGYVGLFLFGAAILGLGLIATSLTSSHLVAGVIGVSLALLVYVIDWIADMLSVGKEIFNQISLSAHFDEFTKGLIDVQHIIFFFIWIIATITIATIFVESYKWR